MDFHKLSDFQLYSIINSRHLDERNREQAEWELEWRHLPEERMNELKKELSEKTKAAPSLFNFNLNRLLLLGVTILLFLLRQCIVTR